MASEKDGYLNSLSEEESMLVNGGINIIKNSLPHMVNEIGLYNDENDRRVWIVSIMREKGEIFELGRFLSYDKAEEAAKEFRAGLNKIL